MTTTTTTTIFLGCDSIEINIVLKLFFPPRAKHADLIADLGHLLHDVLLILQATLLRLRARLGLAIVLAMGDCKPGDGRD